MHGRILLGDNRETLKTLPAKSVQLCITSPPYWGLRDYGTAAWEGGATDCDHVEQEIRIRRNLANAANAADGGNRATDSRKDDGTIKKQFQGTCGKCGAVRVDKQLGCEPTPEEYIANQVAVFRDVKRVLRDDGLIFVNIGDSYAGSSWGSQGHETGVSDKSVSARQIAASQRRSSRTGSTVGLNVKPKDMVGIPWMLAFALRADGWYLRSDCIWHKPNPMPSSVKDRPTTSHEYVFILSKSAKYYWDHIGSAEPVTGNAHARGDGINPKSVGAREHNSRANDDFSGAINGLVSSRNMRSVWSIGLESYKGAHFACYPSELVRRALSAGAPSHGVCPACGAGWVRTYKKFRRKTRPAKQSKVPDGWQTGATGKRHSTVEHNTAEGQPKRRGNASAQPESPYHEQRGTIASNRDPERHETVTVPTGWESQCGCLVAHRRPDLGRAVVLDPYGGSGTTAQVAEHLGYEWVICELNADYVAQAEKRIRKVPRCLKVKAAKSIEPDETQGRLF